MESVEQQLHQLKLFMNSEMEVIPNKCEESHPGFHLSQVLLESAISQSYFLRNDGVVIPNPSTHAQDRLREESHPGEKQIMTPYLTVHLGRSLRGLFIHNSHCGVTGKYNSKRLVLSGVK